MNKEPTHGEVTLGGQMVCRTESAQEQPTSIRSVKEAVYVSDRYYKYKDRYYVSTSTCAGASGQGVQGFGLVGSAEECHRRIHAQTREGASAEVAWGGCPCTACTVETVAYGVHPIRWLASGEGPVFVLEDVAAAIPYDADYGQRQVSAGDAFVEVVVVRGVTCLTEVGVHDMVDYGILYKGVRTAEMREFRRWFISTCMPRVRGNV